MPSSDMAYMYMFKTRVSIGISHCTSMRDYKFCWWSYIFLCSFVFPQLLAGILQIFSLEYTIPFNLTFWYYFFFIIYISLQPLLLLSIVLTLNGMLLLASETGPILISFFLI